MKRKGGKYTYIPKDEIAEVRTFNDVSFESDDLLDGAYVRGRKKFKHGGMTHKRPMSLEEQAAESVGYDTWYAMEAVDQKELVDELLVSGMINPMFADGGMMAKGGMFEKPIPAIMDDYGNIQSEKKLQQDLEYLKEAYQDKLITKNEYDKSYNEIKGKIKFLGNYKMADGGMMAKGGIISKKSVLSELSKLGFGKEKAEDLLEEHIDIYEINMEDSSSSAKDIAIQIEEQYNQEYADGGELRGELIDPIPDDYVYLGSSGTDIYKIKFKNKYDGSVIEVANFDVDPISNRIIRISPKEALMRYFEENFKYGGETSSDSFKQSAIDEALKIAQFAYENDITASGNSLEKFSNKIFDASGISYAKAYLALAYQSMRNQGFADGGEISYVVKYSMKDTPEVVKEKIFSDKDAAELFHETISDDEDLVVMDLQVLKPKPAPAPAPAKKSSLFASAKPVPATAAARKKQREQVQVNGIADEIARYDQLKATINNAKAEQEVIGGRLKELGREKFLDLYEQRGVRPANFDLADGDQNILLEVTDKYLKVEPEKAELLRQYDGLLEEKTTYEFDSEILEKEVSDGMTIGDVVSMLIQDSKLIPDSDKANLIKAKMSMRVPKGTLDRLMQYDNPREVFSLISPILALK
jgi:hypothetical protein